MTGANRTPTIPSSSITVAITIIVLTLPLFYMSYMLAKPSRNWFGDPSRETLLQECEIPDSESTIRLYLGVSSLNTNPDWFTVTYQPTHSAAERQFFYSHASPTIRGIYCHQGEVIVATGHNNRHFEVEEVEALVKRPHGLRRGEEEIAQIQPLRLLKLLMAIVFLICGVLSISFAVHHLLRWGD